MYKFRFLLTLLCKIVLLSACGSATPEETTTPQPPTLPPVTATEPLPTLTATAAPTDTPLPTLTAAPTLPATPVGVVTGLPQGTDGYAWWNDTVFYEIFVRSFYDSDGDGIGDFNGITAKLDYLNDGDPATNSDLGITGLWLLPINPSPSYHGYDVTDYYAVNPQYGTMEDFKRLIEEAHKRGIRVTIDWVLNHTSSQHPWFKEAQDPASPFRQWYVWSATPPTGQYWNYASGQEYYYARFGAGLPDLNYANPEVVKEMEKATRFWLQDVGVDGFRLDAVKHIFEDGTITENVPETHTFFEDLRKFYKSVNPQALTVGEVASSSDMVRQYVEGDELDLAFDFDLARKTISDVQAQSGADFGDVLSHEVLLFHRGQFATFLTNHDQDRAMSVLNDDVEAAKNAAFLLLTSPGVPYMYYGEEIGMLGMKPDENIRLPMQWSSESNAGFTTGTSWHTPNSDFKTKNVADESADPSSLLSLYRQLIQIRNEHAALRVGDYYAVETGNQSVFANLRVGADEIILVLTNLGSKSVDDYTLNLNTSPMTGDYGVAPLLDIGTFTSPTVTSEGGFENYEPLLELPPYGRFILQLQPNTK